MSLSAEDVSNVIEDDCCSTDAEYVTEEIVVDSDPPSPPSKRKSSEAWRYFTQVDRVQKIARCNSCGNNISYFSTVSNLMKHVRCQHADLLEDTRDRKKKQRILHQVKHRRKFRSPVWKHFDVVDAESRVASCRLCGGQLSFITLSNLSKHLERKHWEDGRGEDEVAEEQNSEVWAYFNCLSENLKIASCLVCEERLDYSDCGDLTSHLRRKHPTIQAELENGEAKPTKLMITGEGDVYEIEEEEANLQSDGEDCHEQEMDTLDNSIEYLEENIFNDTNLEPVKKTKRISHENHQNDRRNVSKYVKTKSRDEKRREHEPESSLDIFGKYIVSLLKRLPKQKSDKLQADFVRQIMEAQSEENTQNISLESSINNVNICASDSTDNRVTSNQSSIKNELDLR